MDTTQTPDATGTPAEEGGPPLPSFPRRLLDVFVSPGHLAEALAARPAWAAALVTGAALVVLQIGLIPPEIWEAMFRQVMLEQGQGAEAVEFGGTAMRVGQIVAGPIFWMAFTAALAGVFTFLFAFILGDEGRYTQYLAVYAHALLIPAVVGLALVPLRIAEGDPQLTLSLGTFFFFLEDGWLFRFLSLLDLSQLWALLVMAQGAHAIDARRSFGSAAVILLALNAAILMVLATFVPG